MRNIAQLLTAAKKNAEQLQVANALNLVASLKFYLHLQFTSSQLIYICGGGQGSASNSALSLAAIRYDYQMIWMRFIGTHAEYDKIDANKI